MSRSSRVRGVHYQTIPGDLIVGPPGPSGPQGPPGAPGAAQADESAVTLTRDAQGRIEAVTRDSGKSVIITRDADGTMTGFTRNGKAFVIVRNPAGQIVRVEPAA
ncbi:hypothetical protein NNJEOMEG_00039 [Fundidesulfovibrio magnetotacticus]|uniref:Uncharacterized protein n=1 Tax=Fundidesulfovibrio magnetotacticus TaxID=2730080 RepID=A0A6V8LRJ2_9BACT|nr:hypothetical protein [Fundidesulfovibrio magnetotacticus]GFK92217.1 hypothetical protein NNJEOMEG_00039 [Fundidesulfovibrio magnetotacticus]